MDCKAVLIYPHCMENDTGAYLIKCYISKDTEDYESHFSFSFDSLAQILTEFWVTFGFDIFNLCKLYLWPPDLKTIRFLDITKGGRYVKFESDLWNKTSVKLFKRRPSWKWKWRHQVLYIKRCRRLWATFWFFIWPSSSKIDQVMIKKRFRLPRPLWPWPLTSWPSKSIGFLTSPRGVCMWSLKVKCGLIPGVLLPDKILKDFCQVSWRVRMSVCLFVCFFFCKSGRLPFTKSQERVARSSPNFTRMCALWFYSASSLDKVKGQRSRSQRSRKSKTFFDHNSVNFWARESNKKSKCTSFSSASKRSSTLFR